MINFASMEAVDAAIPAASPASRTALSVLPGSESLFHRLPVRPTPARSFAREEKACFKEKMDIKEPKGEPKEREAAAPAMKGKDCLGRERPATCQHVKASS